MEINLNKTDHENLMAITADCWLLLTACTICRNDDYNYIYKSRSICSSFCTHDCRSTHLGFAHTNKTYVYLCFPLWLAILIRDRSVLNPLFALDIFICSFHNCIQHTTRGQSKFPLSKLWCCYIFIVLKYWW